MLSRSSRATRLATSSLGPMAVRPSARSAPHASCGRSIRWSISWVRFAIAAAPEINDRAQCKREHDLGIRARDYVRARTRDGVILRPEPGERDVAHGRLQRHVYAADGGDIEAELIARGLAVRFVHGARRHDWCRP